MFKRAISLAGGALALWVLSSAAQPAPAEPGAKSFVQRCAACHGKTAAGNPGVYPPLSDVGKHAATEAGRTYLVSVISVGILGKIEVGGKIYSGYMPGLRASTSAKERADILNWLIKQSKARATPFTAAEISRRELVFRTPAEVSKARPRA